MRDAQKGRKSWLERLTSPPDNEAEEQASEPEPNPAPEPAPEPAPDSAPEPRAPWAEPPANTGGYWGADQPGGPEGHGNPQQEHSLFDANRAAAGYAAAEQQGPEAVPSRSGENFGGPAHVGTSPQNPPASNPAANTPAGGTADAVGWWNEAAQAPPPAPFEHSPGRFEQNTAPPVPEHQGSEYATVPATPSRNATMTPAQETPVPQSTGNSWEGSADPVTSNISVPEDTAPHPYADTPGETPWHTPTPGANEQPGQAAAPESGIQDYRRDPETSSLALEPEPTEEERLEEDRRQRIAELQHRWLVTQAQILDDPRDAVREAGLLIGDALQFLTTTYSGHRDRIERSWKNDDSLSTDELRDIMRRYRGLFQHVLSVTRVPEDK